MTTSPRFHGFFLPLAVLAVAIQAGMTVFEVEEMELAYAQEVARGCIEAAVNIPIDELRARLEELPQDRQIAAYCQVGQRGYLATRILNQSGFSAVNISGGYKTFQLWSSASLVSFSAISRGTPAAL